MKNSIIIIVVVAIIAGTGGFFVGMKYQQSQQPIFSRQFGTGQGPVGAGGQQQNRARMVGRQVTGEIISQDDKSITVKLQDGSSRIVLLSDTTIVDKTAEGSKSDLKVGERVGVFGANNSDGTITAQNIQLNPTFRGPRGATGGGSLRP